MYKGHEGFGSDPANENLKDLESINNLDILIAEAKSVTHGFPLGKDVVRTFFDLQKALTEADYGQVTTEAKKKEARDLLEEIPSSSISIPIFRANESLKVGKLEEARSSCDEAAANLKFWEEDDLFGLTEDQKNGFKEHIERIQRELEERA